MEKMPYQPELDTRVVPVPLPGKTISSDWQQRLPVLSGKQVVLRELRVADAASLFALLTTEEVSRFISPPPTSVEGFERFIAWTHRQRAAGSYVCFAVTLQGFDTAIGIFQVRQHDPASPRRNGALPSARRSGAPACSRTARSSCSSSRSRRSACTASRRVRRRSTAAATARSSRSGAVQECVLRKSFVHNGQNLDQVLYAILEDDWRAMRTPANLRFAAPVRVH